MAQNENRLRSGMTVRQILLMCGILSSMLYLAMNIFVPMRLESYSYVSHTISELSAVGVATRPLWVWLGAAYTLLVLAFGLGVWGSAGRNRPLRVVGGLMIAYAVTGLAWPLAPMHQRDVLAAGGGTLADTLHLVLGGVTGILYLTALGFGAAAFGKGFRLYSIVTLLVTVVFSSLTGMAGPRVGADLPTPWLGVWERIFIGGFIVWIVVLATILLRAERRKGGSTTAISNAGAPGI
jgi:hypothetical protein